jgi:hypothetical protein
MSHEQSETIQDSSGNWINIYGKNTPQAGQPLPLKYPYEKANYPDVNSAVEAAKRRSADYTHAPIPTLGEQIAPQGFTKYILPDGRKVLLSSQLPQEHITQAIGAMLDQSAKIEEPVQPPQASPGPLQQIGNAYSKVAGGVNRGLQYGIGVLGAPTSQVGQAIRGGPSALGPDYEQTTGKIANVMGLPQTPAGALGQLGTMGAGRFIPAAGQLAQSAARVGGATLGGGLGGAMGPEGITKGAIEQGTGALIGETIGKTYEITRRGITNLTNGLYNQDARKIAKSIGEIIPEGKGINSPEELRDWAISGRGRDKLFKSLDDVYTHIQDELAHNQTYAVMNKGVYGESLNMSKMSVDEFKDARKELTKLFKVGWGQVDQTQLPTPAAMAARESFYELKDQVVTRLPDQLKKEFLAGRQNFRVGMNIIDLLKRANGQSNRLFQAGADKVDFKTNRLQTYMSANEANLRTKLDPKPQDGELGQEIYDAIAKEVFRGAKPGMGDTEGISLGRLWGRQSLPLSGGALIERFPVLSAPNYAGRPFTPSSKTKTLMDMLMQKVTPLATPQVENSKILGNYLNK